MTATKYYTIGYTAPAKVGISFDIKADEWDNKSDLDKAKYTIDKLKEADGELDRCLGGSDLDISAYVLNFPIDLKGFDITRLEIED